MQGFLLLINILEWVTGEVMVQALWHNLYRRMKLLLPLPSETITLGWTLSGAPQR